MYAYIPAAFRCEELTAASGASSGVREQATTDDAGLLCLFAGGTNRSAPGSRLSIPAWPVLLDCLSANAMLGGRFSSLTARPREGGAAVGHLHSAPLFSVCFPGERQRQASPATTRLTWLAMP